MPTMTLVCNRCKQTYAVEATNNLKDDTKHCPQCGSDSFRQTFTSYLRNGALLDPQWACGNQRSPFG